MQSILIIAGGLLRSRIMEPPRYRSVLRPNMALFFVFDRDHISNEKLADIGCASRRCMSSQLIYLPNLNTLSALWCLLDEVSKPSSSSCLSASWRMVVAGEWQALENGRRWRMVLILALDFSSGPLTNFKGAFHKIPCGHSPLKVMIMSQKWLPLTLRD